MLNIYSMYFQTFSNARIASPWHYKINFINILWWYGDCNWNTNKPTIKCIWETFNLIKIQLFIILSLYYCIKNWQRPIVGHVQMTLSLTNKILAYQIQKVESPQSCLYVVFWLAGEIPRDGNNKGRLHMTSYGPLSDLHTIV